MSDYPIVDYPSIIEGVVSGNVLRIESLDGDVMNIHYGDAVRFNQSVSYEKGQFILKNFKPFQFNGKTWGITHLQKFSTSGYLKVEPDCYHWWKFWTLQKMDANANWLPGTESGIYLRKSRVLFQLNCWRWDVAGTIIDGQLRHWIRSGGYLGGHWD